MTTFRSVLMPTVGVPIVLTLRGVTLYHLRDRERYKLTHIKKPEDGQAEHQAKKNSDRF